MDLNPAVGAARTDEEEAASEAPLPEEDVSPCITGDDDPDAVEETELQYQRRMMELEIEAAAFIRRRAREKPKPGDPPWPEDHSLLCFPPTSGMMIDWTSTSSSFPRLACQGVDRAAVKQCRAICGDHELSTQQHQWGAREQHQMGSLALQS